MIMNGQLSLKDTSDEYKAFVEKFEPKRTTDDCYTPPGIYEAVLAWVRSEYGIGEDVPIVRPFWPGGDYEREEYPPGCLVVDNPPFSILAKICKDYQAAGIRFFLFAPYLTNFSGGIPGVTSVIVDAEVEYDNGAKVATAFLTNLEPQTRARACPDLCRIIREEDKKNRDKKRKTLQKYAYPDNLLTAHMLGYMAGHGISYRVAAAETYFVRALDEQRSVGKAIFGGGYLLSNKAAAEKAAAEKAAAEKAAAEKTAALRWKLSERELQVVEQLSKEEDKRPWD